MSPYPSWDNPYGAQLSKPPHTHYAHYTSHTTHYTPHTTHYTPHTTHHTLHTTHYTPHTTHHTPHTTHYTPHTMHTLTQQTVLWLCLRSVPCLYCPLTSSRCVWGWGRGPWLSGTSSSSSAQILPLLPTPGSTLTLKNSSRCVCVCTCACACACVHEEALLNMHTDEGALFGVSLCHRITPCWCGTWSPLCSSWWCSSSGTQRSCGRSGRRTGRRGGGGSVSSLPRRPSPLSTYCLWLWLTSSTAGSPHQ